MQKAPWNSAIVCVAMLVISASGCAVTHGNKIDIASADRIMVGSTKKSDIVQMFGQPPIRRSDEGFDTWIYKYTVEKGDLLFGTTGHDTTQLVIAFMRDVVAKCQIIQTGSSVFSNVTQDSRPCGKSGL